MKIVLDRAQIQEALLAPIVHVFEISNRELDLNYFHSWMIGTSQLGMFTQATASPSSPDIDVIGTITTTSY